MSDTRPCDCPREAWAESAENGEWYCLRCGFELTPDVWARDRELATPAVGLPETRNE